MTITSIVFLTIIGVGTAIAMPKKRPVKAVKVKIHTTTPPKRYNGHFAKKIGVTYSDLRRDAGLQI